MHNEKKMHANESNIKGTWSRAQAPETNKTISWSVSEPVLEWILDDFGFMLGLEYADFQKPLESDRPPEER